MKKPNFTLLWTPILQMKVLLSFLCLLFIPPRCFHQQSNYCQTLRKTTNCVFSAKTYTRNRNRMKSVGISRSSKYCEMRPDCHEWYALGANINSTIICDEICRCEMDKLDEGINRSAYPKYNDVRELQKKSWNLRRLNKII